MHTNTEPPRVSHGLTGRTVIAGSCRLTEASYPPGQRVPRHEHALPSWTFVVSGLVEETFSSDSFICRPGNVLMKPATADHTNRYGPACTRCLLIEVSANSEIDSDVNRNLFSSPRVFDGGLISNLAGRIYQDFNGTDRITAFSLESLLIELRLVSARHTDLRRSSSNRKWLNRIRDHLETDFRAPPSLSELACIHNLHPVYICQEFAAAFGMSIGEFVRRVRFEWAREAVGVGFASLSDVALAAGYSDQSHLCRDFQRRVGVSPRHFRRAAALRGRPIFDKIDAELHATR